MTDPTQTLSTRLEMAERELEKIEYELNTLIKSLGIKYSDYSFNPYINRLTLLVESDPPSTEQMKELERLGGFGLVTVKWTGGCA